MSSADCCTYVRMFVLYTINVQGTYMVTVVVVDIYVCSRYIYIYIYIYVPVILFPEVFPSVLRGA